MLSLLDALLAPTGILHRFADLAPLQALLLASAIWSLLLLPSFALSLLSRSFRALPRASKTEWLSRVVSNIHALASSLLALLALLRPSSHAPRAVLLLGAGYFTYDSALVLANISTISMARATLFHHAFLLAAGLYAVNAHPLVRLWAAAAYVSEASTPFVNARWFASFRYSSTKLYIAVGAGMTLAFFVFRVLYFPWLSWYMVQKAAAGLFGEGTEFIGYGFIAGTCTAVLYALNLYWFGLMLKGIIKVITGGKSAKEKKVD